MGLDITAYKDAEHQHGDSPSEEDYDLGRFWVYGGEFPERLDGMPEGTYSGVAVTGFRAGSYSGYNYFRERLSMIGLDAMPEEVWAHPATYQGKPFFELVQFSDCEGAIGPKSSAKLADDFDLYRERAMKELPSGWTEAYDLWRFAFRAVAGNGFVIFH